MWGPSTSIPTYEGVRVYTNAARRDAILNTSMFSYNNCFHNCMHDDTPEAGTPPMSKLVALVVVDRANVHVPFGHETMRHAMKNSVIMYHEVPIAIEHTLGSVGGVQEGELAQLKRSCLAHCDYLVVYTDSTGIPTGTVEQYCTLAALVGVPVRQRSTEGVPLHAGTIARFGASSLCAQ
jgi:hypothetical protein